MIYLMIVITQHFPLLYVYIEPPRCCISLMSSHFLFEACLPSKCGRKMLFQRICANLKNDIEENWDMPPSPPWHLL